MSKNLGPTSRKAGGTDATSHCHSHATFADFAAPQQPHMIGTAEQTMRPPSPACLPTLPWPLAPPAPGARARCGTDLSTWCASLWAQPAAGSTLPTAPCTRHTAARRPHPWWHAAAPASAAGTACACSAVCGGRAERKLRYIASGHRRLCGRCSRAGTCAVPTSPCPALTMLPLQAQGATRPSSALSKSQQMRHRRSSTGWAPPPRRRRRRAGGCKEGPDPSALAAETSCCPLHVVEVQMEAGSGAG